MSKEFILFYQIIYLMSGVPAELLDKMSSEMLPDLEGIRQRDFPLLDATGRVYLDNAAMAQVPHSVIDEMHEYRKTHLRGSNHGHESDESRDMHRQYALAKKTVRDFFGAGDDHIAFTSGTTESANNIATRLRFDAGDLLLLTDLEHNSNMLTATNFARGRGVDVAYVPATEDGRLALEEMARLAHGRKGRVYACVSSASNVTGVRNSTKEIKKLLGHNGVLLSDEAQSAPHGFLNFDDSGSDFAYLSAYKLGGPTGLGILFIRRGAEQYLDNKISGGSAVTLVGRSSFVPAPEPAASEPGTKNLEGVIEFRMLLEYLSRIGMDKIEKHERALGNYFLRGLMATGNVTVYGPRDIRDRVPVFPFNIGPSELNYSEMASALNGKGISVRSGCFCAHNYLARLLGIPDDVHEGILARVREGESKEAAEVKGAVRVVFSYYNTPQDAYRAVQAIRELAMAA